MNKPKRKLFIGSSKEALQVARHVKSVIRKHFRATITPQIWTETTWQNLEGALTSLSENIDDFYYAIFIGFPDDKLKERGVDYLATRDNTIFEFGLFLSRLGNARTFFLRPRTTTPEFKLLTDLNKSLFVHSYDVDYNRKSSKWTFKRFDSTQLIKHINEEEQRFSRIESNPRSAIASKVNRIKAEFQSPSHPRTEEFYINTLRSELDQIIYAKKVATGLGIQEIVIDTLEAMRDIDDICNPKQLAYLQSYKNGIRSVWVLADNPLEFTSIDSPELKLLRRAVTENLKHGVKYTYFVDPAVFNVNNVDRLLPVGTVYRKNIEVIFVESQYFKTFFTMHLLENGDVHSLYMSSILKNRSDLLIQISDHQHITRVERRLAALKGKEMNVSNVRTVNYTLR